MVSFTEYLGAEEHLSTQGQLPAPSQLLVDNMMERLDSQGYILPSHSRPLEAATATVSIEGLLRPHGLPGGLASSSGECLKIFPSDGSSMQHVIKWMFNNISSMHQYKFGI